MRKFLFIFTKIIIKRAFSSLFNVIFSKLFNKVKRDKALETICCALDL